AWNCRSARSRRSSIHSGSSLSSEMSRMVSSSSSPFSAANAAFCSFLNSKRFSESVSRRWSCSELIVWFVAVEALSGCLVGFLADPVVPLVLEFAGEIGIAALGDLAVEHDVDVIGLDVVQNALV